MLLSTETRSTSLQFSEIGNTRVDKVVKKVYSNFTFIGQNIEHTNWNIILQLYKMLVSLYLDRMITHSLFPMTGVPKTGGYRFTV